MTQRALARIDLSAVERNCAELSRRLSGGPSGSGSELCAVVKADGYGHGAAQCARAAIAGGASWLAVATAQEAADLRRADFRQRILVMGALSTEELDVALEADADVVAWRESFMRLAARMARSATTGSGPAAGRARMHVKLDTGMGRLGTRDTDEALSLVEMASRDESLELAGFMTHFATADEPDSEFFEEQLACFTPVAEQVKGAHSSCIVHAANSAAVFRDRGAHFDMARCGIAVYGLDPFHDDPSKRGLDPVLALESYVADIKLVAAGESVGYGRSWRADRDTLVGILPIGYGDGYRRGLSNKSDVIARGRRHPVVGTISMDNVTVELGPDTDVRQGDVATLIGAQGDERLLAEELARRLDTINYEITCGITPRVSRLYHQRGALDEPG
jgi:alanine racemase